MATREEELRCVISDLLNQAKEKNAEVERLRSLLLLALYHHQGGSSPVGQPIRAALGIGQFDKLTPEQIAVARAAAAWGGKP